MAVNELILSSDEFSDVENDFFNKEIKIETKTSPDWFDKEVPVKREFKRKDTRYKYKVEKKIFSVNDSIKKVIKINTKENIPLKNKILYLDNKNNIYINEKGYKIKGFIITDICINEDKILIISQKNGIIQEMDINTKEIMTIRKNTSENGFRRILIKDHIYLLGTKLIILDKENYEILKVIESEDIKDFIVYDNKIILLHNDKIVEYVNFEINRVVEIKGFGVERIFYVCKNIYIAQRNELTAYNNDFNKEKTYRRIKGTVKNMIESNGLVIFHTEEENSLKIIENNKLIDYIPNSKIKFPVIRSLEEVDGEIVFTHSKYISSLKIYN